MHKAFLKSIVEEPQDDVHRLVYADWLDDNGDEARAEFIRVQCELAAGNAAAGRRRLLEERERKLLALHESEWAGAAAGYEPLFRRGFVGRVMLDGQDGWACAEQMRRLRAAVPRIEGLKIGPNLAWDMLPVLLRHEACRGLRELDLSVANCNDGHACAIENATALALERLDMRRNDGADGISRYGLRRLAESQHLSGLRVLNLSKNYMGATDDMRALADHNCRFKLRELDLSGCSFAFNSIEMLSRSAAFSDLRKLSLGGNGMGSREAHLLASSPHLGKLETLNVESNHLGDRGAHALIDSAALHELRHLDLSGFSNGSGRRVGRLLDSGEEHLKGLARLRSLALRDNGINPDHLPELLGLRHLEKLQTLDLSGNPLGCADAEVLAATRNLRALQLLRLSKCRLGDAGISLLKQADNFNALSHLDVSNNETKRPAFSGPVESAELGAVGPMTLGVRVRLERDHPRHVAVRE